MQTRYFDDFVVGERIRTYSRTITEGEIAQFCNFVGYHVPLFIDEEFAKTTRYGGRIAPSSLIMSVSTGMTEKLFHNNMVALVAVERGRFYLPLRAGDTIRTEVVIVYKKRSTQDDRGIVTFRDQVFNQRDEMIFEIDKIALIQRIAPDGPRS